jgi:predicted enzyme related to lactoylglutathione lyase
MPEMSHYEPGTPSWVDVSSPDTAKSADFYGALFGWTYESAGPVEETGGYGMFAVGGKYVAGMGPQMDPNQPVAWMTYVSVSDAEATAARVEADGGGIIMAPMQVMTAGTMGIFTDTSGAIFAVWQPAQHIGAQIVNEPNTFCWAELHTSSPADAQTFYERIFNWRGAPMDMGGTPYTVFNLGEHAVAGMMPHDGPAGWGVSFAVDDCDASIAKCQELGGSLVVPPVDSPVGRFATVADPNGAQLGVIKLA